VSRQSDFKVQEKPEGCSMCQHKDTHITSVLSQKEMTKLEAVNDGKVFKLLKR
jgi:hypothetical protein